MKYSDNKVTDIQIAYIGGGSRGWAWTFMTDLALEDQISGTIRLYDIDSEAAKNNEIIGNRLMQRDDAKGDWKFETSLSLKDALTGPGRGTSLSLQYISSNSFSYASDSPYCLPCAPRMDWQKGNIVKVNNKRYHIHKESLPESSLILYTLVSMEFQRSLVTYGVLFLGLAGCGATSFYADDPPIPLDRNCIKTGAKSAVCLQYVHYRGKFLTCSQI